MDKSQTKSGARMTGPPDYLDGAKVLIWTTLGSSNQLSGRLRLYVNGNSQTTFHGLAIAAYEYDKPNQDQQVYLFFCNEGWEVQNDTFHSSIDQAKEQAAETFMHLSSDWHAK